MDMQPGNHKRIRVGLSTCHGMSHELANSPPEAVEYGFPQPLPTTYRLIRSPIKSFLRKFDCCGEFDLLEAVLSPIITEMPWVCSLDCYQAALAFNVLNLPLPRSARSLYVNSLFRSDNCKRIIFWSNAARNSLQNYGHVCDKVVIGKSTVVYPAIREQERINLCRADVRNLLFSGDFFRKGGINVLDAFEELQQTVPDLRLRICSDPKFDFTTRNSTLRNQTLKRLHSNPAVTLGRVSREQMLREVLPRTDVYLLPTYGEAFGFAAIEAMSFGIPVIATNVFALPEIIESGKNGMLIDVSSFDLDRMFRGYVVNSIPPQFRSHVSKQLKRLLLDLIESSTLRNEVSYSAVQTIKSKFSVTNRNRLLSRIYEEALEC